MGLNPKQSLSTAQESSFQVMRNLCNQQIGDQFGCIPLDQFVTYQGPDVYWETIPDIFQAHRLIKDSGIPNFLGHRIPVQTNLNVKKLEKTLGRLFRSTVT